MKKRNNYANIFVPDMFCWSSNNLSGLGKWEKLKSSLKKRSIKCRKIT
jgi:hypothetical protein